MTGVYIRGKWTQIHTDVMLEAEMGAMQLVAKEH